MPKRECPFDDHLSPQLKVHVGQKEVSNGANKEQEMKKVYEKTLSLLKKGSKEFDQKLTQHSEDVKKIIPMEKSADDTKHKSGRKQMIFDDKMKLKASDKDIDLLEGKTCKACITTAPLAFTRCFYCNDFKCLDCMEECIKCQENFCDKCSLILYEGGEHTECWACYH